MRLNEITFDSAVPVDGYGPGFFRVGGVVFEGPVIVSPGGAFSWQGYSDPQALIGIGDQVDVFFVGTGADVAHLPEEFRKALEQAGVGVEAMASPAACRTFNILASEGRRVGLALLPV